MHHIDQMWESAARQFNHVYRGLSTYPDSTWDAAAPKMRNIRRLYDRQAVRMGTITPPKGMKPEQQAWLNSVQLEAQETDDIASGLADHSVSEVNAAFHVEDRIGQERTRWRIAALTLARKYHVHVQRWVHLIGLNRT